MPYIWRGIRLPEPSRRRLRFWQAAAIIAAGSAWLAADTEPPFVQRFRIVFGNLHAHTAFSDGSGFPDEAFAHARQQGLDFMGISEHNHTNQIRPKDPPGGDTIGSDPELYTTLRNNAATATQDGIFVALFGQEYSTITSGGNHTNIFGLNVVIDEEEVPNGAYRQLYEEFLPAHPETQFLQFNHPFDNSTSRSYGLDQFSGRANRLRAASERWLRTIEVINGPGTKNETDLKAEVKGEARYRFYLTRGFRLAPVADQDNHFRTWGNLTGARTGCLVENLSLTRLLEAIRARRCYASTDRNLKLWFGVNGEVSGSQINAASRTLKIQYKIEDPDPDDIDAVYRIQIVHGNPRIADSADTVTMPQTPGGNHSREFEFTTGHNQTFLYLRITQHPQSESNRDEVVSAPVWILVP